MHTIVRIGMGTSAVLAVSIMGAGFIGHVPGVYAAELKSDVSSPAPSVIDVQQSTYAFPNLVITDEKNNFVKLDQPFSSTLNYTATVDNSTQQISFTLGSADSQVSISVNGKEITNGKSTSFNLSEGTVFKITVNSITKSQDGSEISGAAGASGNTGAGTTGTSGSTGTGADITGASGSTGTAAGTTGASGNTGTAAGTAGTSGPTSTGTSDNQVTAPGGPGTTGPTGAPANTTIYNLTIIKKSPVTTPGTTNPQPGQPGGQPVPHPGQPGGKPATHPGQPGGKPVPHPGKSAGKPGSHSGQPGGKPVPHPGKSAGRPGSHSGQPGGKPGMYPGQSAGKTGSKSGAAAGRTGFKNGSNSGTTTSKSGYKTGSKSTFGTGKTAAGSFAAGSKTAGKSGYKPGTGAAFGAFGQQKGNAAPKLSTALLSSLAISSGIWNKSFDPNTFTYHFAVASNVNSVTIEPGAKYSDATVTVNGGNGNVAVLNGIKTIVPVVVTRGTDQKTYVLVFDKPSPPATSAPAVSTDSENAPGAASLSIVTSPMDSFTNDNANGSGAGSSGSQGFWITLINSIKAFFLRIL